MKLFSFRKQKQQEGFAFLVKDMFDLRDGGVVVAGQVTEGIIHQGERAVCITGTGSSFACVIDAIEQPNPEHQGRRSILRKHGRTVPSGDIMRCGFRGGTSRISVLETGCFLTPGRCADTGRNRGEDGKDEDSCPLENCRLHGNCIAGFWIFGQQ